MRQFNNNEQVNVKLLGKVNADVQEELTKQIFYTFNTLAPKFKQKSKNFNKAYVIYAIDKHTKVTEKEKFNGRDERIRDLIQPLMVDIDKFYPGCEPALIKCITLTAGTYLDYHIDEQTLPSVSNKIVLPILNNEKFLLQVFDSTIKNNEFYDSHSSICLDIGSYYAIDDTILHRFENAGATPCIYITIDMVKSSDLAKLKEDKADLYHLTGDKRHDADPFIMKRLKRFTLTNKLLNKNTVPLLDNLFLNDNEPNFQVKQQLEEYPDIYYSINNFDSGLCVVDGMSKMPELSEIEELHNVVEQNNPLDIYFVDNVEFSDYLSEKYDLYNFCIIKKQELSDIDFINEHLILYLKSDKDRLVIKACLKEENRNVSIN